jgi:purine-binding chemotaxis protein CheW
VTERLVVSVGGQHYALPVEHVLEVARIGWPTPVPGAPPEILGVQSVRGRILPVLDLSALLGHEPTTRVLSAVVVERRPICAALAVDAAVDFLEGEDRRAFPGSSVASEATVLDGATIGTVDIDLLFSDVLERVAG